MVAVRVALSTLLIRSAMKCAWRPKTHYGYNLILNGGSQRNQLQEASKVELQEREDVRANWPARERLLREGDALRRPTGLMILTAALES